MIHIALHFIVPALVAFAFYRTRWGYAALVMIATMLVDLDHLLADPIYDPERCSIGFHPLHITPAILLYVALFLVPLLLRRSKDGEWITSKAGMVHLVGLGLVIHMILDGIDCFV